MVIKMGTKMSFDELSEKITQINTFLESADPHSEEYEKAQLQKRMYGSVITSKAVDAIGDVMRLRDTGVVSESYFEDAYAELAELADAGESIAKPYLETANTVTGFKITLSEVLSFSNSLFGIIQSKPVNKILNIVEKKYVKARLNKYTIIYPQAVSFTQLESTPFTLAEALDRFHNLNPKYAEKWQEDGLSTHCKVYTYKDKAVMAIFYTTFSDDINKERDVNVETLIVDSSFKKHEDYYNACMASQVQICHPSIKRVLKDLKDKWNKLLKKQEKEVQESVSDAIISGTYDEEINLIEEAVENGMIDRESAETFKLYMTKSEFKR